MSDIKEKKFLNKVRKQVIFADEVSRTFYRKIEVTTLVDHSKSYDAILTSVKNIDLQVEICFICHKSDHTTKECFDWFKVNVLKDDKFNHSNFESNSDLKN